MILRTVISPLLVQTSKHTTVVVQWYLLSFSVKPLDCTRLYCSTKRPVEQKCQMVLLVHNLRAIDCRSDAFHLQGCTKSAIDVSAMHGHLAVVQWLSEFRPEGCSTNAMDWAAKEGRLVRACVHVGTLMLGMFWYSSSTYDS